LFALAQGGWWGVGIGASTEKWSGLPAAHTDFIFAVIGEELGLFGTLVVLGLFATLAYAGTRIALRTKDPFVRYAAAGITIWLLGQAIINIGMVLGLLPVIGIPLPLVSYGGSALLPTLISLGLLVAFAKTEPGARTALRARHRQGWRARLFPVRAARAPVPAASAKRG
jgi:cell division protein FtsW (lipid II flippase)